MDSPSEDRRIDQPGSLAPRQQEAAERSTWIRPGLSADELVFSDPPAGTRRGSVLNGLIKRRPPAHTGIPVNLAPWTWKLLPRPHDLSYRSPLLKLWDRLDWYLSHPADRYQVFAAKRARRRESSIAWGMRRISTRLRGTAPLAPDWMTPERQTHADLIKRIMPMAADLPPGGDRYDPLQNGIPASEDRPQFHSSEEPSALWLPKDLGPYPADHPKRLVFEHRTGVSGAWLFLAANVIRVGSEDWLQGLKSTAEIPCVAGFFDAWPEIPIDNRAADPGGLGRYIPLSYWPAAVWIDTLRGHHRLFRQPVSPIGIPLGPAISCPCPDHVTLEHT